MVKISVVTTLYNSAAYIAEFHHRMSQEAAAITPDYEIILVNDGSPDTSLEVAISLTRSDPKSKVIDLSRNFGHHKAIMTGLMYAQGDYIFLIDSDLEEQPELLHTFYEELQKENADVVFGIQDTRRRGWLDKNAGALFYTVFNTLSSSPIPRDLLTVRLMSQRYVAQLLRHKEQIFVIAGLWQLTGFKQVAVVVHKTYKGVSNYSFMSKLTFMLKAVTSFSNKPLIYIAYLGFTILTLCLGFVGGLTMRYLIGGVGVDGWTSVIISIWFFSGLIIFVLGIIAIYLSVIFIEVKNRPYTIVREIYAQGHLDQHTTGIVYDGQAGVNVQG